MKILVLAGGADQIALIKELKKYDHEIILIDYFKNPPAKPFADKHIIASTLDTEVVKEIALTEKVNLIVTACTDQALLTVAKVSEELALPSYISYRTALNVTNKSYMKEVFVKNAIPTAKYIILDSFSLDKLSGFHFPLVVKPVDCNSSKGVKKVMNWEELKIALTKAIEYSRTKTAIVEEYLEGKEISADFFIENGKAKLLSVTGSTKIRNNNNSFTILQSCYPVTTINENEIILTIAQNIANSFKLKNTPLLIQMILNNEKFNVIEFSARMGGGSKYKLIEVLSGVNIMQEYVRLLLGYKTEINPCKMVEYALMNYIYCHPGTFKSLENFENLKDNKIIQEYFQYKTSGMEISKAETSSDRPAGYLIIDNNKKTLNDKLEIANAQLRILDIQNKDIMNHDLLYHL